VSISNSLVEDLSASACAFVAWLDRVGYKSYDPYDLWGTRYGLMARRLYYAKHPLGIPLIAPTVAAETLLPSVRKLFVHKQRFATADAQLLLAFLNLHHISSPADTRANSLSASIPFSASDGEKVAGGRLRCPRESGESARGEVSNAVISSPLHPLPLARAQRLADDLLATSIPGYSGHCWGYPFDWQNNRGLWKRNTPFITATPYCYEAFAQLHEITRESRFREIAVSAARFVYHDLNDSPTSDRAAASSYGPLDHTYVINASAYRAWVLFDAAHRFGTNELADKARANLNFILESQRADGAWLYALNSPAEAFIDHFHTCFVLKNLWKINQLLNEPAIASAFERGYAYYRKALFTADGLPKSFAIQPRTQLVKLEMYNVAEAITLGALLRDDLPGAFEDACRLARFLIEHHQVKAGCFTTRIFIGGWRHTFPFLRWPQSQLFYALTNLLRTQRAP
jgi:hypothetical protein